MAITKKWFVCFISCLFVTHIMTYHLSKYQNVAVIHTQNVISNMPSTSDNILSSLTLSLSKQNFSHNIFEEMTINGVKFEKYYENNLQRCIVDNNMVIFDVVFMHSEMELSLLEMRIFEYTKYVNHFIIVEHMHYTTGKLKNFSFFGDPDSVRYIRSNYRVISENWNKIITKQVYLSYYDMGVNEGIANSDQLTVIYWETVVRNMQTQILYEECYKIYDSKCMNDNFFVTSGDLDEILRSDIFILLKLCSNIVATPITVNILQHYYDFNCVEKKFGVSGKTQIHTINKISFDLRNNNILPLLRWWAHASWRLIAVPKTNQNLTFIFPLSGNWNESKSTQIDHGGWHITSFGNVSNVVWKNKHRGHSVSRNRFHVGVKYTECIIKVCGHGQHGARDTHRNKKINFSDNYYPLYVKQKIYNKYPKHMWLKNRIETHSSLFNEWTQYIKRKIELNQTDLTPEQYCEHLYRKI
eukprot:6862_1